MLNDATLLDFARRCAKAYCARFSAWSQYDDAVGESCVFLLEHRWLWTRSEGSLKRRVVLYLVRQYQDERGLRRKRPWTRVDYDLELVAAPETNDVERREEDERTRDRFRRALRDEGLTGLEPLLAEALEETKSRKELAREYGVSTSALSKYLERLRRAVERVGTRPGVEIVDATDANDCPLFAA